MLGEDLTGLPADSRKVAVRWLNKMLREPGVKADIRALALQTLLELTIWEAEQKRLAKLSATEMDAPTGPSNQEEKP